MNSNETGSKAEFQWYEIKSELFSLTNILNRVNADKLFVSFLMALEESGIDGRKRLTISEVIEFIPKGTAGVSNHSTYGFSITSMFSSQSNRDYFLFENANLSDEFAAIARNNRDRDNYVWKKHYMNEGLKINPKYLL